MSHSLTLGAVFFPITTGLVSVPASAVLSSEESDFSSNFGPISSSDLFSNSTILTTEYCNGIRNYLSLKC